MAILDALLPYEFSPTVFLMCWGAIICFFAGLRKHRRAGGRFGLWRSAAFVLGVLMVYTVLQTPFDYIAQHMFFMHRIQHLCACIILAPS